MPKYPPGFRLPASDRPQFIAAIAHREIRVQLGQRPLVRGGLPLGLASVSTTVQVPASNLVLHSTWRCSIWFKARA